MSGPTDPPGRLESTMVQWLPTKGAAKVRQYYYANGYPNCRSTGRESMLVNGPFLAYYTVNHSTAEGKPGGCTLGLKAVVTSTGF